VFSDAAIQDSDENMPTSTRLMRLTADEATCARAATALEELLDPEHTALATSIADDAMPILEVYFETAPDEAALRAAIAAATSNAVARAVTFEDVTAQDWVAASLAGLAPVRAGRIVVHGAHDRGRVPQNAIGIEIEDALAFGTGHHGTTRGCLLALAALAKRGIGTKGRKRSRRGPSRGVRVLDLGTGTAVLAIAAAKLLRRPVLASDIDPVAVRVAQANAHANNVGGLINFVCAAGVAHRRFRAGARYDLIFANILLGPLKALARPASSLLAPGGRIVLSGLLPAHANAALSAYRAQGLRLERRLTLEGWTTLVLTRG
jgi:ribosomal protein L11 methyltransferase